MLSGALTGLECFTGAPQHRNKPWIVRQSHIPATREAGSAPFPAGHAQPGWTLTARLDTHSPTGHSQPNRTLPALTQTLTSSLFPPKTSPQQQQEQPSSLCADPEQTNPSPRGRRALRGRNTEHPSRAVSLKQRCWSCWSSHVQLSLPRALLLAQVIQPVPRVGSAGAAPTSKLGLGWHSALAALPREEHGVSPLPPACLSLS